MSSIAIVSGGFDPLHIGHLHYLQEAGKLGLLYVLLNSDAWLIRKKKKVFMTFEDRMEILMGIRCVEKVLAVNDDDNSVTEGIRFLREMYEPGRLIFCNGGDRVAENTPEVLYCRENNIEMRFNVGGGKVRSSSEMLAGWGQ